MKTDKGRALVVEDEFISASFLRSALAQAGFAGTVWARDGREALELAAGGGFDLVFMDIKLPGSMDGIETAEAIRSRCAVFIVFVSGYQDEDLKARALAIPSTDYLEKPFLPERLRRLLDGVVQG